MAENRFTLKTIVEYTSLFTVYFLLVEGIRQFVYYDFFNFNISSYFSFTFLLNALLGSISYGIAYLISGTIIIQIMAIQFGFGLRRIHADRQDSLLNRIDANSKNKIKSWWKRVTIVELWMLIFTFNILFIIVYSIFNNNNYYKVGVLMAAILLFAIYTILNGSQLKNYLVKNGMYINFTIFILSISFLSIYLNFTYIQYNQLISSTIYRTTAIEFRDGSETIPAHSHEFYIGRTPEYIFVYSEIDSATRVINAEDVKRLNFYSDSK